MHTTLNAVERDHTTRNQQFGLSILRICQARQGHMNRLVTDCLPQVRIEGNLSNADLHHAQPNTAVQRLPGNLFSKSNKAVTACIKASYSGLCVSVHIGRHASMHPSSRGFHTWIEDIAMDVSNALGSELL